MECKLGWLGSCVVFKNYRCRVSLVIPKTHGPRVGKGYPLPPSNLDAIARRYRYLGIRSKNKIAITNYTSPVSRGNTIQ